MKHFFTTKIRVVLLIAVLLAVTLGIIQYAYHKAGVDRKLKKSACAGKGG